MGDFNRPSGKFSDCSSLLSKNALLMVGKNHGTLNSWFMEVQMPVRRSIYITLDVSWMIFMTD